MIQQGALLMELLLMGGALGLFYFGGLWITLRRLPRVGQPILFFGWSYMIRLGAVLGIFHLLLQWSPHGNLFPMLFVSFLGFLVMRTWLLVRISLTNH